MMRVGGVLAQVMCAMICKYSGSCSNFQLTVSVAGTVMLLSSIVLNLATFYHSGLILIPTLLNAVRGLNERYGKLSNIVIPGSNLTGKQLSFCNLSSTKYIAINFVVRKRKSRTDDN